MGKDRKERKSLYDDWYTDEGLAYIGSEGLTFVKKGTKFGYIDKTGKEIIAPQYQNAGNFEEGIAPVKANGKWGYIANPLTTAKK